MKSPWVKIADGSFGSRNGQPWSQALATANNRAKPSDTASGTYGAVVAPSKEALRAAIESQTCPWCGRGPFKMLAMHTNREHGIDRVELRDMAGIPRSGSICSAETSDASRRALVGREDRMEITMRGASAGQKRGMEVARELTLARYEEDNRERDLAIVSAVKSGIPRKEVAASFGITYKTVLEILKRQGISDDGRVDRGRQRKGMEPAAARAGIIKKQAQLLGERQARWNQLGGDHEALVKMAAELGTTHKTLRQYFKSAGCPVPDGRR